MAYSSSDLAVAQAGKAQLQDPSAELGDLRAPMRYHLKLWMGFSDESAAYLPA